MTQFQKRLLADTETLWAIVKLLHPDIPDTFIGKKDKVIDVKKDRLAAHLRYDWVCIEFRVRGFGQISIGISNAKNYKLMGPNVTKAQMTTALLDGTITMKVWRFTLDKWYDQDAIVLSKPEEPILAQAAQLLYNQGYTLQSPDEMYGIYYSE